MAAGTKVQLRLGDRVVTEVGFRDGEIRIGRMKENDLVINNLAVSRFHAVLRQVGEAYEIEDLGSENGTWVAGVQVRGTAPLPPGAQVGIGKHVLTLLAGGEGAAPVRSGGKSDAWDAAQTYFAPALAPRFDAAPEIGEAIATEAEEGEAALVTEAVEEGSEAHAVPAEELPAFPAVRALATSLDLPDPEGRFAFGDDDLLVGAGTEASALLPAASEFDISASESVLTAPAAAAPVGHETALFDFGASKDLGVSEPSLVRAGAPPAAGLYAGLIVERAGKVERVVAFHGTELVAGRGPTCDVVLSTAGISRRHARFVREGDQLRVFDLGSANGLRVNGARATEHVLRLGDVVAIDDYALTFVLDREPLEQAVRSASAASAPSGEGHLTILHSAPFSSMPERDLVTESDDDDPVVDAEKELEIVVGGSAGLAAAAPLASTTDWVVEVVLSGEELPPALRAVLRELDTEGLRLPAELRIRQR